MFSDQSTVPEGYMRNAQGHLVPREMVKPIDLARDDLVRSIVQGALELQPVLTAFKTAVMGDIAAFVEMSAEQYGAKVGGAKGNVTLVSFDGRYKILRANADHLMFDERLIAAKDLIDSCVSRWTEGARAEVKALIDHAFQADKTGKISTARVLGLTKLNIDDAVWQQAMRAIRDSIQIAGSKLYVRIYERIGDSEDWRQISLDLASMPLQLD